MKLFAKLFRKDKEKPIGVLVDLTFKNMNYTQLDDLCRDIDETFRRKNVSKYEKEMLSYVKELARKEIDNRVDRMAEQDSEYQMTKGN